MKPRALVLVTILCGALSVACDRSPPPENGTSPLPTVPLPDEPGALATVLTEPVHGRVGPGDRPFEVARRTATQNAGHARRFGMRTLETAFRRESLQDYPCTSCHIPGQRAQPAAGPGEDAHAHIRPVHPQETGALCATCHVAGRVDRLALIAGETASLDQPYRLCAQCHAPQIEAWAGGAHGKRLDGWHGRRIVMNCTDCHDPHEPALERRIPFPGPHLPPTGGGH